MRKINILQKRMICAGLAILLSIQGFSLHGQPSLNTSAEEYSYIATDSNALHSENNEHGVSESETIADGEFTEDYEEYQHVRADEISEKFGTAPYDVLIHPVDSDSEGTLEEQAANAQEDLLHYLESRLLSGEVESYKSYYIVNGIHAVIHSEDVLLEILNRPDVRFVTPNFDVDFVTPVPDTSSRRRRSIGPASISPYEWSSTMIRANQVWDEYGVYGEGTVVGIIDTGVNYKLPQLRESYLGYDSSTGLYSGEYYLDLVSDSAEPSSASTNDHGTFVAGIISGGLDSRFSHTMGIAPRSKFINVRAMDEKGTDYITIFEAAQWMLNKRPDVINCSWGVDSQDNPWFMEIAQNWRDAGIVAVFASGNTGNLTEQALPGSILSPANLFNVLAVGAIDAQGKLGVFSKRGPSAFDDSGSRIKPDLTAPGVNVYSLSGSGYVSAKSGTSYAAPFVTATIALMKSVKPDLTVDEIETILRESARPLTDSAYPESPNLGYGYGMVDAYAAVTKVRVLAGLSNETKPEDTQGSSDSTNPTDTANHTEHTNSTEKTNVTESAASTENEKPTDSANSTETNNMTENSMSTKEAKSTDQSGKANDSSPVSDATSFGESSSKNAFDGSAATEAKTESFSRTTSDVGRASGSFGGGGGGGSGRTISSANAKQTTGASANGSSSGGWKASDKGWWYQNADGTYPRSSWMLHNGKWYYFDEAGYAATGWILYNNQWYYLTQDCSMATGWIMSNQKWYYLSTDGSMLHNTTTPDGYRVDASGAWIF